jgi:DnaJ-class molecular chaperone
MARDYYQVLGVPKTSSADEIKKAYRALARKLHPDVNKAPDAQKQFTEVQNAYDVLSDDKKRALYDQHGEAGLSGAAGPGPHPHVDWSNIGGRRGQAGGFDPDDLTSMFETFFGGFGGASDAGRSSPRGPSARGPGSGGGGGGGGGGRRGGRHAPRREEPPAEVHDVRVDFLKAARGGAETLRISSGGSSRSVDVKIPAGIPDGSTMRLRGLGPLDGDGDPTDLLIRVNVDPHPLFRRGEGPDAGKSLDVYVDVPLTIAEAALGATVHVPTLSGSVDLKVPAGTASGRRLRVRGQGIAPSGGTAGDLYAVVQIVPPRAEDLTPADAETLRRIGSRPAGLRSGPEWA